jgi:hypothetical protein
MQGGGITDKGFIGLKTYRLADGLKVPSDDATASSYIVERSRRTSCSG